MTPEFVKPGATVIDVGINRGDRRAPAAALFGAGSPRLADFERRGSVVVGDVHPAVAEVAGALTPVPGGVGPLTIAMLLKNTRRRGSATRAGQLSADMLQAALTGGIATGKSYCLARFAALGVPTIDADMLARDAVAPGSPGLGRGRRALRPGDPARRTARSIAPRSARIVFADRAARADLEAIVHPDVYRRISEWFAELPPARASRSPTSRCCSRPATSTTSTRVIVAACSAEEQLRRLMARDGLSEADARARLAAQWPIDEKVSARGLRDPDRRRRSPRPTRRSQRVYERLLASR